MPFAYHITLNRLLSNIASKGLIPRFAGATFAYDDPYDGLLFFTDEEDYVQLPSVYGDTLLRFPWPASNQRYVNDYGRTIAHQFVTRETIPPESIEVKVDESWIPLKVGVSLGETKTIVCGDCFSWAYSSLPKDGAVLVHATVQDPWSTGKRFDHAWVEIGARVYDWQSVEKGLGPGKRGWEKEKFYENYQPEKIFRYDYVDSRREALRHKHTGPWK